MAISGRIGAAVSDELKDMLTRALLEQQQRAQMERQARLDALDREQFEEGKRRFEIGQAGEAEDRGLRRQQLDMELQERTRAADERGAANRQKSNTLGVLRMAGEGVRSGAINPRTRQGLQDLGGMQLEAGDERGIETLTQETPEDIAARKAEERKTEREEWKFRQDYDENQIRTRPVREQPTRTEMTPGQSFAATRQLRSEFNRETTAAREVTSQLGIMEEALKAAEGGNMAAGSQGVLVTFQKILDPNSVVRESEYARSASGQSLLSRIEGAYTKLAAGGAGIPISELRQFVTLGRTFAQRQQQAAAEVRAQIDATAKDYGIDPARVTRDIGTPETREIEYVRDASGKLVRKP